MIGTDQQDQGTDLESDVTSQILIFVDCKFHVFYLSTSQLTLKIWQVPVV